MDTLKKSKIVKKYIKNVKDIFAFFNSHSFASVKRNWKAQNSSERVRRLEITIA